MSCALAGAVLLTVAGCTSSSDGNGTPPARATVTSTATSTTTTTATATATATATSGGPTSGSTTRNASGPGLCTPTVTRIAVGEAEGAAGTSFLPVRITNASQQACVTTGYPGVALLNAAGSQIVQATRETGGGVQVATITLQPGEQATALISALPDGDGSAVCATSPAFLFTLPDNTDSTKLTAILPVCGVQVRPFVKGDGS